MTLKTAAWYAKNFTAKQLRHELNHIRTPKVTIPRYAKANEQRYIKKDDLILMAMNWDRKYGHAAPSKLEPTASKVEDRGEPSKIAKSKDMLSNDDKLTDIKILSKAVSVHMKRN